jgi:hypothetical protein
MRERFFDSAFDHAEAEIQRILEAACGGCVHGRKVPRARANAQTRTTPARPVPVARIVQEPAHGHH